LKKYVEKIVRACSERAYRYHRARTLIEMIVTLNREIAVPITHGSTELLISVPNKLSRYRAETFSSKEPETLAWIDDFPPNAILWDIGANIGLYSIYAAKRREIQVVAFEPSIFNLEFLARNVELNRLVDRVCIVPLPLNNKATVGKLAFSNVEWGGALSTFENVIGWDGAPIRPVFNYQTVSLSMDQIIEVFDLQKPTHIKIDVDGIEDLILRGGREVLRSTKSVLVEINDELVEEAQSCRQVLVDAGFELTGKYQDQACRNTKFQGIHNQIWSRLEL
jgi:FkbM family methyltransferase